MNKELKEKIDVCIKNNVSMDKDELYCLCKKEIYKWEEENDLNCEYIDFIHYICDKIDY